MSQPLSIFFSVGEPSGDSHAAKLIGSLQRLRPDVEAVGFGGPKMEAAGARLLVNMTGLAVMGFVRAVKTAPRFLGLLRQADQYFREHRPDAVVLVDFPGFNWWVARRAKALGIPVIYYLPPQVWSWAPWRVRKMKRLVDYVLSGLPFEVDWLAEKGIDATFVGHPFFDQIAERSLDEALIARYSDPEHPLVSILPGSRTAEVKNNISAFLDAAERVHQAVPRARFAVAAFRQAHVDLVQQATAGRDLPLEIHVKKTPELIRAADCCMACSGSVSLELLDQAKPTVIHYWMPRFHEWMRPWVLCVKYVTLVNLLASDELHPADLSPYDPTSPDADRVLMPEYIGFADRSHAVAGHLIGWLTDRAERARLIDRMIELRERVAQPGASDRTAEAILAILDHGEPVVPQPHFSASRESVSSSSVQSKAPIIRQT